MSKRLSAAVLLVLVSLVPLRADILEQVLVKVNGDILTKTEFEQRQIADRTSPPIHQLAERSQPLEVVCASRGGIGNVRA